jgi:hypothetical protein
MMQIGYFSLKDKAFFLGGVIYMVVQTFLLVMLSMYRVGKSKQNRFEIAMLEQGLNPLGEEITQNGEGSSQPPKSIAHLKLSEEALLVGSGNERDIEMAHSPSQAKQQPVLLNETEGLIYDEERKLSSHKSIQ